MFRNISVTHSKFSKRKKKFKNVGFWPRASKRQLFGYPRRFPKGHSKFQSVDIYIYIYIHVCMHNMYIYTIYIYIYTYSCKQFIYIYTQNMYIYIYILTIYYILYKHYKQHISSGKISTGNKILHAVNVICVSWPHS